VWIIKKDFKDDNVIGVIKSDGMITEVIDKLFCDGVYDSNAILRYP
jgi:hypothetical protein